MSLKARISDDMKSAMKAGEKDRLKAVRLKLAAIKQVEVDKRVELDDAAVLADAAAVVDLDPQEAKAVLADARFAKQVRQHEAFWTSRGVSGVPTMIFDGRQALIGAQGVENYANVLTQLAHNR